MAQITNKLLKQAIADAEAVRETAVANAKLVLEEAITPQIKDMIARRLRVEAEMAHDEEEKEDKKETEMKTETTKEVPHEDGEAVGGKDFPADTSAVGTGDNKEPSDDAFDASGIGDGGENKEDSHTDWYDDWSESDFDLNEIIAELEADIAALSEGEEEKEEEEEGEEEEVEEGWKKKMETSHDSEASDVQAFSKAPMIAKEEEGEEKESAAKGGMEKTAHMEKDMEKKGDEEEEISLEAILAELEADDAEEKESSDKKEMAAKLAHIKNELAQYRQAVNTLRERLQEVNLLNAKLLFTNKLFKKEGLNNDQKIRIVESFDRATNVREVKLVYAALVENLAVAAKTFNASRKKVVAEGFASKATPTTAPKSEVIVENTVAKRLQQLAGII